MARPRGFDEQEVLRQATALFGYEGFDAVSVDRLTSVLGLSRASFYKIHGSKHGLMRAALEQVCDRARAGEVTHDTQNLVLVALLELAPHHDGLRALTERAVGLCFDDDPRRLGERLLIRARRTPPHREEGDRA